MNISIGELDLAWTLLGQGRYTEASQRAASVLGRFPDNVSALACRAMADWKAGEDVDTSLQLMRRAVSLAPDVASVRHNLATLLASSGDLAGASGEFRQALRIKPDDTMAFYGLAWNEKFTEETDAVRQAQALHESGQLDAAAREFLAFGLAKIFDDLGQPERAMAYAIEANALSRRPFDLAGEDRARDALRRLAAEDRFRRAGNSGHPSAAPIFIVGMNRSGTTLVESILSRHPQVSALGEASMVIPIEYEALRRSDGALDRNTLALQLRRDWLSAQAERTLQQVRRRTRAAFDVITDKLPENAVRLGLVARLFPRARVIHLRRHPLDVGVSNFFQRYAQGQGFAYRMDWIGIRMRQIAESMAIWKQAVDLPVLDVWYEKLVADPEAESRRIVAFSGLDWDPRCLDPQRTQRPVLTASQWQVRQPIYRGSVGRWKRYEPWLGPMIEAMGGFEWIDGEMSALG